MHAMLLFLDPVQIKLLEVIGQGSYGTVHRASWRGSLVAAKVIPLAPRDLRSDQVQREVDILRCVKLLTLHSLQS